jgi:hypothetical protein
MGIALALLSAKNSVFLSSCTNLSGNLHWSNSKRVIEEK